MNPHTIIFLVVLLSTGCAVGQELVTHNDDNQPARGERIAIVVSQQNPIGSLKLEELQGIFLREKAKWPNGETITVYERPTNDRIRAHFSQLVLHRDPRQLSEYWLNLKLTRGLKAPKVCRSSNLVKEYLRRVKGGIAYMYADEVDHTIKAVKFLEVGGGE